MHFDMKKNNRIYIINWWTESGDEGEHGYFTEPLSKEEVTEYLHKNHPEECVDEEWFIKGELKAFDKEKI